MADILAQSLADLATARTAVLEEMKNRYPEGSEVSWRAGKGFSTGHVIGHAPFWSREPTRLQVKSIRNGKTKWVTPYNIPSPVHLAQPAQAVDVEDVLGKAMDMAKGGCGSASVVEWITEQLIDSQA